MFRKSSGKSAAAGVAPEKTIVAADLVTHGDWLLSVAGMPATADSIAFEAVQKLLAVGTSNGKVKLFGKASVEATLFSAAKFPYATKMLTFLQNRGILARVSKGGFVEAWSMCNTDDDELVRELNPIRIKHDKVTCICEMPRDPYVILGCSSGSLRIATLVDDDDKPTLSAARISGFSVAPYRVKPSELQGAGDVKLISLQSFGTVHRLAVLFSSGTMSIWDLRGKALVACVDPDAADAEDSLRQAGLTTACCWIGTNRGDFATGHERGDIFVWSLLPSGGGAGGGGGDSSIQPSVLALLRVSDGDAEPIRHLRCLYGRGDSLLVTGGQELHAPEGLSLVPLPPQQQDTLRSGGGSGGGSLFSTRGAGGSGGGALDDTLSQQTSQPLPMSPHSPGSATGRSVRELVKLPWFGNLVGSVVANNAAATALTGYDEPTDIIQLLGGGQLMIYNVVTRNPTVVHTAFQEAPAVTALECAIVPTCRTADMEQYSLSLMGLRRAFEQPGRTSDSGGLASPLASPSGGVLASGTPAQPPEEAMCGPLYVTGHADGHCRLWDLSCGTPRLVGLAPCCPRAAIAPPPASSLRRDTSHAPQQQQPAGGLHGAPSSVQGQGGHHHSGGGQSPPGLPTALQPVTALCVCWQDGLVISGHQKGDVRMYQFSPVPEDTLACVMTSVGEDATQHDLSQPAGMHLRLVVRLCSHDINALAYSAAAQAVVAGDDSGGVALIDLTSPAVLWYVMPSQQPVLGCAIAPVAMPPAKLRNPELGGGGGGEEGSLEHVVFTADAHGCVASLDLHQGLAVCKAGELRPKNQCVPLLLELLDEHSLPLWMHAMPWGQDCLEYDPYAPAPSRKGGVEGDANPFSDGHADSEDDAASPVAHRSTRADHNHDDDDDDDDDLNDGYGDDERGVDELLAAAAEMVDRRKATERREKVLDVMTLGLAKKGKKERKDKAGGAADGEEAVGEGSGGTHGGGGSRRSIEQLPAGDGDGDVNPFALAAANIRRVAKATHEGTDEDAEGPSSSHQQRLAKPAITAGGSSKRASMDAPHRAGGDGNMHGGTASAGGSNGDVAVASGEAYPWGPLCPMPDLEAKLVLLATDHYLRVYTVLNAMVGDRTTLAKRQLSNPLVYARTFHVNGAPGLVTLAVAEHGMSLDVYSLPTLELVNEMPLSQAVSWHWDVPLVNNTSTSNNTSGGGGTGPSGGSSPAVEHQRARLRRVVVCSPLGHMVLLGEAKELVLLALAAGLPDPPEPTALFDRELALAAQAAQAAYEQSAVQGSRIQSFTRSRGPPAGLALASFTASDISAWEGGVDSPVRTEGHRVDTAPRLAAVGAAAADRVMDVAGSVASKGNALLGGVLSKVHQGLSKVVEDTTKGVKVLASGMGSLRMGDTSGHHQSEFGDTPDLSVVFSTHVADDRRPEEDDNDVPAVAAADDGRTSTSSRHSRHSGHGKRSSRNGGAGAVAAAVAAAGKRATGAVAAAMAAGGKPKSGPLARVPASEERGDSDVSMLRFSDEEDGKPAYRPPPVGRPPRTSGDTRAELFGSAGGSGGGGFQPRQRTASEIKRAYGYATTSSSAAAAANARARDVGAVMEDNKAKLAERGEKLKRLDEKAADLENSAMGFAEMARQLAERERNKKWWQL